MVRYICFPQICKIHLAYFTISVAVMNWESSCKYEFIWETTLQATLIDILVLRKQVVVLAAIEAFDLALLLLVFLVMACASSHRLDVSHPTFNMLLSLGYGRFKRIFYIQDTVFPLYWHWRQEQCAAQGGED